MSYIKKIIDKSVAAIDTDLEGWEKISGTPSMKTWIEYTSEDGSMIAGCWEATEGSYRAEYKSWEYIHLIEGKVKITPEGGDSVTLLPGDSFVIEAGFTGTWEIEEKVFKHFTIKL
ncbi:cupin domain-containing protein [Neptuniibacter pectenicola]|jgi:uncharacterized cupin superfamily protein|uniref:Cupin domain-containing protein n=1 Tax=Neptuniibacter pectenicola TaxID=1806669 RepID=A0ABU9TQV4_9GAMM|nr:cupin domain-containing protein [Neptuniibacter pectenicola]|tara:strand:+ start:3399 stop:3746 length:348 start_codon:yes stop_codon:yes gene_type:complete